MIRYLHRHEWERELGMGVGAIERERERSMFLNVIRIVSIIRLDFLRPSVYFSYLYYSVEMKTSYFL